VRLPSRCFSWLEHERNETHVSKITSAREPSLIKRFWFFFRASNINCETSMTLMTRDTIVAPFVVSGSFRCHICHPFFFSLLRHAALPNDRPFELTIRLYIVNSKVFPCLQILHAY